MERETKRPTYQMTVSPISENEGARIGSTDGHHQSGPSRFSPLAMQSK
jgi:hypothetical protein